MTTLYTNNPSRFGGCFATHDPTASQATAPVITGQPQSTSIAAGGTAVLTVTATGTSLTYQWYVGPSGDVSVPLVGETGTSVSVSPLVDTTYWVRVTGGTGHTDSNGALVSIQAVTPPSGIPTGGGGRWWSSYGDSKWDRKPVEVVVKKKKNKVVEVTLPEFNAERSLKSLEQIRATMEVNRRVEKLIQDALDDEEVITLIFKCL
jgi:hypothetical protein